jgi:hypothetical protein
VPGAARCRPRGQRDDVRLIPAGRRPSTHESRVAVGPDGSGVIAGLSYGRASPPRPQASAADERGRQGGVMRRPERCPSNRVPGATSPAAEWMRVISRAPRRTWRPQDAADPTSQRAPNPAGRS